MLESRIRGLRKSASAMYLLVVTAMCLAVTATQLAQERKEYRTTAKQREVLKSGLASVPDKEGTVLRVQLPAGWVGN